ncbi:carbohydrate-binding module family 13 protein [Amanita thiersii Skay4041]|uniref:Carbohydrate-binding module family 13 protein n=1 Tax=Amanita thiersii Skay4041 TaxID=703135 RepID=A0A2A9NE71_9AGAR|nr:carbohydrate-binding module family 13 protein [Amanita thiersii Skay4041]
MSNVSSGVLYKIQNGASNTYIDIDQNAPYTVRGWEGHDGPTQKWYIELMDGGYVIRSAYNNKYLGPQKPADNLVKVVALDYPFKWSAIPDAKDYTTTRFLVFGTPFALDLEGAESKNGTAIVVYPQHGGANHRWRLERQSDTASTPASVQEQLLEMNKKIDQLIKFNEALTSTVQNVNKKVEELDLQIEAKATHFEGKFDLIGAAGLLKGGLFK